MGGGITVVAPNKVTARRPNKVAMRDLTANHRATKRTTARQAAVIGRATAIVAIEDQTPDGRAMVAGAMKVAARPKLPQPRRRNVPVPIQIRRLQNWLHSKQAWISVEKVRDHVESVVEV